MAFQTFNLARGSDCDRIAIQSIDSGAARMLSSGKGLATGAAWLASGEVVIASTHATQNICAGPPDYSGGYVWSIDPEFELYRCDPDTGAQTLLTESTGYDAEACTSPVGERIVFSSTRSGDVELWSCDAQGSELVQLTDLRGAEGAASFSPDGQLIVFQATAFDPEFEAEDAADYERNLGRWTVAPVATEIEIIAADGSGRRPVTELGGANWNPTFHPDGTRILFSSNHHERGDLATNFDLFAIDLDGGPVERITTFDDGIGRQFDGFPVFSPDGRFLAFASNRGSDELGETNVFVAEWQ